MGAENADYLAFVGNPPESLVHSPKQETRVIGLLFELKSNRIHVLKKIVPSSDQKLAAYFTYLSSNISSTKIDVNICIKIWFVIDRLSIIWEPDLPDKIKREFFKLLPCQYYCIAVIFELL